MDRSDQKNVRFISDKRSSYCCVEGGRGSRKITWKVWHSTGVENPESQCPQWLPQGGCSVNI